MTKKEMKEQKLSKKDLAVAIILLMLGIVYLIVLIVNAITGSLWASISGLFREDAFGVKIFVAIWMICYSIFGISCFINGIFILKQKKSRVLWALIVPAFIITFAWPRAVDLNLSLSNFQGIAKVARLNDRSAIDEENDNEGIFGDEAASAMTEVEKSIDSGNDKNMCWTLLIGLVSGFSSAAILFYRPKSKK